MSTTEPWNKHTPYLVQLPGFGLINAMMVLSAIGDISRFPTSKKLVGYAGLGGCVHDSGQSHFTGPITKQGRKELRWAVVEAAWVAVEHHHFWKQEFQKLNHRMKNTKAIVAIARRLLVAIWHVLTKQVADRFADPQNVARSFLNHAYQVRVRNLPKGQSAPAFTREQLDRLGLDKDLPKISSGSKLINLPPSKLLIEKE